MENFTIKIQTGLVLFIFICSYILCNSEAENSVAPMEEKEQKALYAALQGFVGKWWNGSDLYPDPCGWTTIQGVSCDLFNGFWYVTALYIGPVYDNSLKCTPNAIFRNHLFELKHLKTISFYNCFTSPQRNPVTLPTSKWEKLANSLESLEFRSNRGLVGAIPTTLSRLKNLQSLVLLENGLTGELPIDMGKLVNLRRLNLAGNRFVGQIPAGLGGLKKLLIFDSSRNSLSGTLPITFGGLTSLLKLDLSNNLLEGVLPREIGNLKQLTLLDLSNNKLSGELPTESLHEMVSLEEMVLSNNPIGGDLMSIQWENLQNLEILDLSNMGFTGSIPESMTKVKRLRFLGLNDNSLSGKVPPRLEAMPCIGSLYLNGNNLGGKLEFPERFYERMGSRFRASNNLNLCYSAGLMSSSQVPFGVKPCEQENTVRGGDSINKMSDANWDKNSHFDASMGFSGCGVDGFWWGLMAKEMVIVLLWNMLF